MAAARAWTITDLDRLPDDGNTYEVVRGELFVTPAPSPAHQSIVDALVRVLVPYVTRYDLGVVSGPRGVIQRLGSQLEPDLTVRNKLDPDESWTAAAVPRLVVEVVSRATRTRDFVEKRDFYLEIGVADYWIVDRTHRSITWIRAHRADTVCESQLTWHPPGAGEPLVIDVAELFG